MNIIFFNDFLSAIRQKLRQISYQTKGEYSLGDLENEAYLLLEDFISTYGRYPDLTCPKEINWVPARLGFRFVKRADYRLRKAIRIDTGDESDHPAFDIPAPESANPLYLLLFNESHLEKQQALINSYSEAKAYLVSFDHFDADKQKLSTFLCITSHTLGQHVERSIETYIVQSSLFDGLEIIDHSFMPCPGMKKSKISGPSKIHQSSWKF